MCCLFTPGRQGDHCMGVVSLSGHSLFLFGREPSLTPVLQRQLLRLAHPTCSGQVPGPRDPHPAGPGPLASAGKRGRDWEGLGSQPWRKPYTLNHIAQLSYSSNPRTISLIPKHKTLNPIP